MIERDEKKIADYLAEIVKKIVDLHLWWDSDLLPYLEYCKKKCDDFPEDVNYREAVNLAYARYVI